MTAPAPASTFAFPGIYAESHQNPADFILMQIEAAIENWEQFGVTTVQSIKVPESLFLGVSKALGKSVRSTMGDWEWDSITQNFVSEHRQALTVKRGESPFWAWQSPFRGVDIVIQNVRVQALTPAEYAAMSPAASQVSDTGDEQPEEGEAVLVTTYEKIETGNPA